MLVDLIEWFSSFAIFKICDERPHYYLCGILCYDVCHVIESGLYCACACCVWVWCEDFVVCSGVVACVVIA